MESILECSICELQSVRIGKHYGAISCYPCRSFFRRTPERKRTPRCKFGGSCLVYHTVKTHCPGCRYNKCLFFLYCLAQKDILEQISILSSSLQLFTNVSSRLTTSLSTFSFFCKVCFGVFSPLLIHSGALLLILNLAEYKPGTERALSLWKQIGPEKC